MKPQKFPHIPQDNDILYQISGSSSNVSEIFRPILQDLNYTSNSIKMPYETRGPWTEEEDNLLRLAVSQFGPNKWVDIARFVPTRTAKQCRERWFNQINPMLRRGPFEPWEDQVIIQQQRELGNQWTRIANLLPGRSSGAVKNRWHAYLKSKQFSDEVFQDNAVPTTYFPVPNTQTTEKNEHYDYFKNDE